MSSVSCVVPDRNESVATGEIVWHQRARIGDLSTASRGTVNSMSGSTTTRMADRTTDRRSLYLLILAITGTGIMGNTLLARARVT